MARGATDLMAMFELPAPEPDAFAQSGTSGKPILHGVVTREGIEKFTLGRIEPGEAD